MKQLLILVVCLLSFSAYSAAQTVETFDIATYQPPAGWKKQSKPGVVIFVTANETKGTYAMITVFGSSSSSGKATSDFQNDWQEFVVRQMALNIKPEIEPVKTVEGWNVITGGSTFQNEQGTSAIILNTFSGYGKSFSLAAMFNSQDNLPAIEAFVSSLTLNKTQTTARSPAVSNDSNASILGTWGVSASDQSSYAVRNAISGYIVRQYTFNADGTYVFYSKSFQPFSDRILLGKENGTYQLSGNSLTISPKASVIEAWSKNAGRDEWGNRLNSQGQPLEKVTYQFTRHYFSGINTWSLVFQAANTTKRDGPYSGGSAFNNAWIYSPPCDQCFIKLP